MLFSEKVKNEVLKIWKKMISANVKVVAEQLK